MKLHIPNLAGGLLGLVFVIFGLNYFFHFIAIPSPPEGSPPAMFLGAMYTTGFLTFIKVLEIAGGVLVAIPKTRNMGLLVLGPIVVNILAFHVFLTGGATLGDPVVIAISVLSAYLLWSARKSFARLLN